MNELSQSELDVVYAAMASLGERGEIAKDVLQRTLHELQVHRIEVETQNRQLRDTQEQLEQSVRRFVDLYDTLPIGYLTVTPAGQILEANLAAAEMLRSPREGLVGKRLVSFLEEQHGSALAAHLNRAERENYSVAEFPLRTAHHEPLIVQFSSRPAGEIGRGHVLRVALTDVTSLKQTQLMLEESNREQENFSYSISHDLRSPLITISNFASLIQTEYAGVIPAEPMHFISRIQAAAARMDTLLADLLAYSRVSRGTMKICDVELNRLVSDILTQHQGLIENSHAEVIVRRPLLPVRGTPEALLQIVANLLTNALKFTAPGAVPRVEIFSYRKGDSVVLVVADQGIGIASEHRDRIFRMFERLHSRSEYAGTGVGLAIAKRAVERMNGRIWVESEPGRGSRFHIELPSGEGDLSSV